LTITDNPQIKDIQKDTETFNKKATLKEEMDFDFDLYKMGKLVGL
jgi:hypothetical protein